MPREYYATFWKGERLTKYEEACLLSFANRGHEVRVYSFEPVLNLPNSLVACDAREIVEEGWSRRFIYDGKVDITHFTDLFRYKLFERTECTWIDTDIVLLKDGIARDGLVIGWEDEGSLCGAIMRIPSSDPKLPSLISACEAFADTPLTWGDTGPRLLSSVFGKDMIAAIAAERRQYYPIHYFDFWKIFSPAFRDECAAQCENSSTLHLWNNLIVKLGLYKNVGPPAGSYLHECFSAAGCIDIFEDFYPASVMDVTTDNFLARVNAGDYSGRRQFGIGTVSRLIWPAILTTIRNRSRSKADG